MTDEHHEPDGATDRPAIVLVDADPAARQVVAHRLRRSLGRVIEVDSEAMALAECRSGPVALVIVSARDPAIDLVGLGTALRSGGGPPAVAYGVGASADAHLRWYTAGGADGLAGDDPGLIASRCRAVLGRIGRM